MEKQEIGKFNAVSFNEDVDLEFIVYNDNSIDCPALELYEYNRINLKPRFELIGFKKDEEGQLCNIKRYVYDVKSRVKNKNSLDLIGRYDIDEELFAYLKENDMIRYSSDMAHLYGFSDKDGYDKERYGVSNPYKRAKRKGPILVNQKKGYLN